MLVGARTGLRHGRPVVDALPCQLAKPRTVQLAIGDARGDQDGTGAEGAAVRELDEPARALDPQSGRVQEGQKLGTEPAGLVRRPARQIGAAQTRGEAKVILDPA